MMSYLLVSINESAIAHMSKHTCLFVVPGRFGVPSWYLPNEDRVYETP
jgi:hypothetical protein